MQVKDNSGQTYYWNKETNQAGVSTAVFIRSALPGSASVALVLSWGRRSVAAQA